MRSLDAMKAFEHAIAVFFGDSDAGIADPQLNRALHRFQRKRDRALERKLERVGQKVRDNLFPHVAVDVHHFTDGRAFNRQLQAGVLHRGAEHACDFRGDSGQLRRFIHRLYTAGLDA
jgi:hypothetical protein